MRTKEERKVILRDRSRVYRQIYPEKIEATNRAYYLTNREKVKAQTKAYRGTHREEVKATRRAYRQAHRGELNATSKAYQQTHREEVNAYNRAYSKLYRQVHQEQMKAKDQAARHRRRALKGGVEHQPYKFEEIAQRDRGKCGICHKRVAKADQSIDHILPLSLGGADAPYNVQLAHLQCNTKKNNSARFPANLRLALI